MSQSASIREDVVAYVSDLGAALRAVVPDLVGVYLHGSAVLGGFRPATSDVDVLAVVAGPGSAAAQRSQGEALAAVGGCPGTGLEMSVITAARAAHLGDCRYEVHVNTTGPETVIVPGAESDGDPDLVLHCAVCRDRAAAIVGPPAAEVFGPIPRERVLTAMLEELRWGRDNASSTYAVLNACRAARYADDSWLCSKLEGGAWYLARHPDDPVVRSALDAQRHGGPAPTAASAAAFVDDVCAHLDSALTH